MLAWALLGVVLAGLAFIRLAPTDAARWHQPVLAQADKDMAGGAIRVIDGDMARLQALLEIAERTPRTRRIAGSVEAGLLTFETRSKWIGFPDYTTVDLTEGQISMFARLRFGKADLGVNKARLEGWIEALDGG